MVVCTSRRHGNTDYSGNICHDVTDKQQLQGADSAPSMVIGGAVTISYLAFNYDTLQLPTLYWLFIQSLSLYIVYLSFQTLFFERFIACFKIKGNVGFSSHPSTLSDTQERFVCFFSKNIAARISTGCNSTTNFRDG